jgi:hypothetical protein
MFAPILSLSLALSLALVLGLAAAARPAGSADAVTRGLV